jgi:hypothetical protein
MERLKKKDAESGAAEKPLTDEQRARIAEIRNVHAAGVAERKIMFQSQIARTFDPAARAEMEADLRRDLERFEAQRDEKIRKVREG